MGRGCRIYVGSLPSGVRESDVEDRFKKFGKICDLMLKNNFAFVEYDDDRDADDAVRDMDNSDWDGARLRVEVAKEKRQDRDRGGRGGFDDRGRGGYDDRRGGYDDRGRGGYDDRRGGGDRYGGGGSRYGGGGGDRYGAPARGDDRRESGPPRKGPRSTGYRLQVDSLPSSASWQDLKDHARQILGYPCAYAAIFRDRGETMGILEYETLKDLETACEKLHKTTFSNRFERDGKTVYAKIEDDTGVGGAAGGGRDRDRGRSRSRSKSRDRRSRSRSRSKSRGRSPSKSRSRSPARDKSRSPSRGRSPAREEAAPAPMD